MVPVSITFLKNCNGISLGPDDVIERAEIYVCEFVTIQMSCISIDQSVTPDMAVTELVCIHQQNVGTF